MDYTYSYDFTTSSLEGMTETGALFTLFAGFAAFLATYALILTIVAVIGIISMWKIFTKAGKPGWAAIIPIYNTVVLFQISGLSPWLLLIGLIPGLGQMALGIIGIIATFRLATAFGKGVGYGFGLLFLPIIFYPILAFGDAKYTGYVKDSNAAFEKPYTPTEPVESVTEEPTDETTGDDTQE